MGAGDRGRTYAEHLRRHPEEGRVGGIAEPDTLARERFARRHDLSNSRVFPSWEAALQQPRFADGVIIATQDRLHAAPAIAFAEAGWHILLEKPLACTPEDCLAIVQAAERTGVLLAVAHVLRYTPETRQVLELVRTGAIGELVGAQRLEPVGFWHFAHSYVRGNWRRADLGSPVLLAKCCHDLDWLCHVFASRCVKVSSFGVLRHFRAEMRPSGAADRCLECPLEPTCAYSAPRLYLGELERGNEGWPVTVVMPEPTPEGLRQALEHGPYGRCVYACDNDVPDHQVVNLELEGGRLASFTMSAFTPALARRTTLFGTKGWLSGDGRAIEVLDFASGQQRRIEVPDEGGHGGGDAGLLRAFVTAMANGNPSLLLATPREALHAHLVAFAAERARLEDRVVAVSEVLGVTGFGNDPALSLAPGTAPDSVPSGH